MAFWFADSLAGLLLVSINNYLSFSPTNFFAIKLLLNGRTYGFVSVSKQAIFLI